MSSLSKDERLHLLCEKLRETMEKEQALSEEERQQQRQEKLQENLKKLYQKLQQQKAYFHETSHRCYPDLSYYFTAEELQTPFQVMYDGWETTTTIFEECCCDGLVHVALAILSNEYVEIHAENIDVNKYVGAESPLHSASRLRYQFGTELVEKLLEHGAKINDDNNVSFATPLHLAVANKNPATVKLLLQNGANPYHKLDKYDRTPYEEASESNPEIRQIFESFL